MARLNTSVPPSDSTRENSLYRMTPSDSGARGGAYSHSTPHSPPNSDKENENNFDGTPRPTKAKGKGKQIKGKMGPPNKPNRKPLAPNRGEHNIPASSKGFGEGAVTEDYVDLHYYDPDQNPAKRRRLRQDIRRNDRDMHDNRDSLMQSSNEEFISYIERADRYMNDVRQTSDATLDSRFLVNASDLALKRATNLAIGDTGIGIDVDEFVSKCATFMRNGGPLAEDEELPNTQTRRQSRRSGNDTDDEEIEDNGDGLDWAVFGELACFPNNKRPPVPGFLLGPLSVQKRERVVTRREPKKKSQVAETKPEELKAKDLQQAESANLTSLCRKIRDRLITHIDTESSLLEKEVEESAADLDPNSLLAKHRLAQTDEAEPAVSLFDFAINPHSFGQTVENIFYISFLIRDGNVKVDYDEDNLPILVPSQPRNVQEKREQDVSKNQAIFSLDYKTWKQLVEAYQITQPLIEHRHDEGQKVSAKGWYG